jgi:hypothetical protein
MSRLPTTSYGVNTVWKIGGGGGGEMCIRSIMNNNLRTRVVYKSGPF